MSTFIRSALRLSVTQSRISPIFDARRLLSIKILYTAEATAQGGRDGHVKSSDGIVDLDLTTPKGLGGPGQLGKTNPEQLFASGYAACFRSAMSVTSKELKTELPDSTSVTSIVHIGPDAEKKFGLAVELKVHAPGVDKQVVQSIADAAHKICPYSRSTRGNIDVILTVA